LLNMVQDPIPNIRFNVAKAFEVLIQELKSSSVGIQTVQEQIVPALQALSDDPDADVRYYAQKALVAAQDM